MNKLPSTDSKSNSETESEALCIIVDAVVATDPRADLFNKLN
jgi:hypothetical protein